jgi:copper chaperone CopZ
MNTVMIKVPDISCDHCKTSIEGAVAEVAGVASVAVDVAAKTVAIVHDDSTSVADVVDAIEEQGYEVIT